MMPVTSRRIPRQRRPAAVARPGRIYLILTRPVDHHGRIVPGPPEVGYIGQTRQQVWQRAGQHRISQPFSDLITEVLQLDQGVWTDAQLDAREEMWIRAGVSIGGRPAQRPRYNHDCNLENPDRIEIFRAEQHRRMREPSWARPVKVVIRPRSSWLARKWLRYRLRVITWAVIWTGLCGVVWWQTGWTQPRNAAIAATAGTIAVWIGKDRATGPRKRRRRGRRR